MVRTALAAATLSLAAVACGSDSDATTPPDTAMPAASVPTGGESATTEALTIADPWSRMPAEGQVVTAVYGVVTNNTDAPITIVSASSPLTSNVELHETLVGDEGTMSMQEAADGFAVPAGGTFAFEPGGPHIMLFDIDAAGYPSTVDVTITGDGGESLTFAAEVREIAMEEMEESSVHSGTTAAG